MRSPIAISFALLLLPIAVAFLAVKGIKDKKRGLAITMTLFLLLISMFPPSSQIDMFVVAIIAVLLFSRSARDYFMGTFTAAPAGQTAGAKRAAVQTQASNSTDSTAETQADEADEQGEPSPLPAKSRLSMERDVEIRPGTAQDATVIYSLMQEAFDEYRAAVPPSSALDETIDSVREALQSGTEAAILLEDDRPTAMVLYKMEGDTITFSRLSVVPSRRRRGYGKRLIQWVERQGISKGMNVIRCRIRQSVQNYATMYENMGYEIVDQQLEVRPGGTVKILTLEKKLGV